ncbi:MFS transporter [Neotamlana laminarinivorans]|uniref:MFS transporter n=1 Tax=Neotamlana laminarinivorans TaxID=2883124 RepID=A0A9X1I0U5_9FLAO|nr:MFS transporter [Tamlana laminarinivorans]MCB4799161.1 MFS transporter [Tamlana laminarinivorans]
MPHTKQILPLIVIAQFCCTSLWFASNSVIDNIILDFDLNKSAIGNLTSAIQFGFIIGTLVFAIFNIADRFSASKVFFVSAVMASLFNLGIVWQNNTLVSLLFFRFVSGFFLAGIYPVGMKIASDYFKEGLGKSLSFLVGALVIGTAFPHILNPLTRYINWQAVILTTSALSILGGVLIFSFVPNGPYLKINKSVNVYAFATIFKDKNFRNVAFGYFGHMWELYTFWAFVPVILKLYQTQFNINLNISLWSFIIIASGSLSCVIGGYISRKAGTRKTIVIALTLSGLCCLIAPFLLNISLISVVILFLIFWGMVVIMDSPLLSTLVAQNADAKTRGTALTIVNCIGYSITIISIQLTSYLLSFTNSMFIFIILAIGPVLGVISLVKNNKALSWKSI